MDIGKHALDIISALLKRLEVLGLKIEEDKLPFSRNGDDNDPGSNTVAPPPGGGYNPYGTVAPDRSAATPSRLPVKHSVAPRKDKPSFLKRLFGRR